MITAIRDTLQSMQWQPIESAPRDGTYILLLMVDGNVEKGYFQKSKYNAFHGFFIVNNGDYTDGGYGSDYKCEPTHWMPLPTPPQKDAP